MPTDLGERGKIIRYHCLPFSLLWLMMFGTISSKAQHTLTAYAGPTFNTVAGYPANALYKIEHTTRLEMGVSYYRPVSDWMSMGVQANYIQRGFTRRRAEPHQNLYHTISNDYLGLSVLAQVRRSFNRFQPFLEMGIYGAYLIKGTSSGLTANVFNSYWEITPGGGLQENVETERYRYAHTHENSTRRFDGGVQFGLGTTMKITDRYAVYLSVQQHYSFKQPANASFHTSQYANRTTALLAGVSYRW